MEKILTLHNLKCCFRTAQEKNMSYIGISLKVKECAHSNIIIIPNSNFKEMLCYYENEYDENLIFKRRTDVFINGFTYGQTLESIETDFNGKKENEV